MSEIFILRGEHDLKIKMQLLSDVIFGSGVSVPGGEDISVLCDKNGFPYYKGGTFKGIFREELERLLEWKAEEKSKEKLQNNRAENAEKIVIRLLGKSGDSNIFSDGKLIFSDFTLSDYVKNMVLEEFENQEEYVGQITNLFTNTRVLTSMEENGIVKKGSLRMLRCVNKGLYFYSEILCDTKEEENIVREVLPMIKWIGSMRNRGFGKVKITVEE